MDGRGANARAMEGLGGYNPPATDPRGLDELRRQQEAFAQVARGEDLRNSWLAAPILAAEAGLVGLGGAALLAGGVAAEQVGATSLGRLFSPGTPYVRGRYIGGNAGNPTRDVSRKLFERAYGRSASDLGGHVHHHEGLRFANLSRADPTRLSNLWGLPEEIHAVVTRAENAFARSLNGRMPSPAEIMKFRMGINKLVEPYLLRPGVARPTKLPDWAKPKPKF